MDRSVARIAAIRVYIFGADPLSEAGMAAFLRGQPEVELVDEAGMDGADVALLVADVLDDATLRVLRAMQRDGCPRVVLLIADIDPDRVGVAVQAGAVGIVRRCAATRDGLLAAIRSAALGEGVLPPDLLGGLLRRVRAQAPVGGPAGRPSARELQVLRLLSEGCDTREIARELSYSERTVKNIIQDVTRRFGLRNRSHAVAYALRHGLI